MYSSDTHQSGDYEARTYLLTFRTEHGIGTETTTFNRTLIESYAIVTVPALIVFRKVELSITELS